MGLVYILECTVELSPLDPAHDFVTGLERCYTFSNRLNRARTLDSKNARPAGYKRAKLNILPIDGVDGHSLGAGSDFVGAGLRHRS